MKRQFVNSVRGPSPHPLIAALTQLHSLGLCRHASTHWKHFQVSVGMQALETLETFQGMTEEHGRG